MIVSAMQTTLEIELIRYVEELRSMSEICQRPTESGNKCPQCYERLIVAARLEHILKSQFDLSESDRQFLNQYRVKA